MRYLCLSLQVKAQLDLMKCACSELAGCDDFVTLLQEVLQTGNRLNEGTMRGAAAGAWGPWGLDI